MNRWCCGVLCAFLVGPALARGGEPKVVGDPTGAFRRDLEGVWGQGDARAPDRVELAFTWQKVVGPNRVKRPAIAVTTFRKGEAIRQEYGPVWMERRGKKLFKWGGRMYEYRLKGKTLRLKVFTPPWQFDEEGEARAPDPDILSGEWTKQDRR